MILSLLAICLVSHTQTGAHGLFLKSPDAAVTFFPVMLHHAATSLPFRNGNVEERWNDRPLYKSAVKKGKLHGTWQSWYQNGQLCDSGSFYKNLPDGQWKFWDEQGKLTAIRTYSADKYERLSFEITRSNPRHVSSPLVTLYRRNRREALKHFDASASFDGIRQNGKNLRETVQHNVSSNDQYTPVFSRALHHGLFANYFPNGEVRDSGYYKNGLRDGIWIHVSEDGTTLTGYYKDGLKSGVWKRYDVQGRLLELVEHSKSGEIVHRKSFIKKAG